MHNTESYSPIPAELVPHNFDRIGMSADAVYDYLKQKFQEDINKNIPDSITYDNLNNIPIDYIGCNFLSEDHISGDIKLLAKSLILTTEDSEYKYQIALSNNTVYIRKGVITETPVEEPTNSEPENNEIEENNENNNKEIVEENNENEEEPNQETPGEEQTEPSYFIEWSDWEDIIKASQPFTNPEITYLKSLFAAEKQQEFENKFSVITTGGSSTNYWADQTTAPNPTSEVAVTVKFNNVNIDTATCSDTVKSKDGDSAYWDDSTTGVYKHTIDKTASSKASSFTYSPSEGDYAGLTVTKQASAKSVIVTPKYPSWYIIVNANKTIADNFAEVIALLNNTHRQENPLNSYTIDNRGGSNGVKLWIITKSNISSIKDEMSLDFKDSQGSNKSFISPSNNSITLDGYNVYVTKTVGTDSSTGYVKVNIS